MGRRRSSPRGALGWPPPGRGRRRAEAGRGGDRGRRRRSTGRTSQSRAAGCSAFWELSAGRAERAWEVLEGVSEHACSGLARGSRGRSRTASRRSSRSTGSMPPTRSWRCFATRPGAAHRRASAGGGALRCAAPDCTRGSGRRSSSLPRAPPTASRRIGFPLDRARALFVAGEALRRSGKRTLAAERIEAAKEIFERLGAALWVERAETELRRARPRPRRDRELTSAERRVAALVAAGLKNREVASQLCTTEATVEKHLTRRLPEARRSRRAPSSRVVSRTARCRWTTSSELSGFPRCRGRALDLRSAHGDVPRGELVPNLDSATAAGLLVAASSAVS